jgi:uncharacterized membrane protein YccC
VDGAGVLSQRFEDNDERLTEEEVQSIVKRYGEKQAGNDTRATVADVAEALQVEPSVVTRILREVRTADSERELKERLDALERENEQLRERAERSDFGYGDFYSSMHWTNSRRMRRRGTRIAVAATMAALIAVGLSMQGGGRTPMPVFAIVATVAVVVLVLRLVSRLDR